MASLIERMLKMNSNVKASVIADSDYFVDTSNQITTTVPVVNVALSGKIDGGLSPGLTTLAGESKSFKTLLGLLLLRTFLQKYKDGIGIIYDSEYGITPEYLSGMGIDTSRVIHIPIRNIETLVHDFVPRLEEIDEKKDKVFILIDSVGNLASKKEAQDALDGKSVADMSRAKALKSLFRIVTPYFAEKGIYCVAIQHVYKTMEMYAKTIVSGGQGSIYSSNTILIITKSTEKNDEGTTGFNFTLTSEKSRYVKEKAKMRLHVTYENGIDRYSAMFDWAVESGYVREAGKGWWQRIDPETGELLPKCRRAEIEVDSKFFDSLLDNPKFRGYVEGKYKLDSVGGRDTEKSVEDESPIDDYAEQDDDLTQE